MIICATEIIEIIISKQIFLKICKSKNHKFFRYRMLVPMVDTIFADVAQPDQARIVAINASYFLKTGGHFVISIKANCIDSTAEAEAVFAGEVKKMQAEKMKPQEQVTLEPYERDHAVVVGIYRPQPKKKD